MDGAAARADRAATREPRSPDRASVGRPADSRGLFAGGGEEPGEGGTAPGDRPASAAVEVARRLALLILLRVLVSGALFGSALSVLSTGPVEEAVRGRLYVYLVAAFASAALEFVWLLFERGMAALAWVHVAVETLLAGWLVALTGGPAGPFGFLALLSTVHGALAAGSAGAAASALLATGVLWALAGLPSLQAAVGTLPVAVTPPRLLAALLADAGGCFATAALSAYLTERLQRTGRALSAREAELRSLGDLYRSVVRSLGSGLLTLVPSGGVRRVTLLNEAGARILGVDPEEAPGRTLADISPALDEAVAAAPPSRAAACEIARDGEKRLLDLAVSSLRGPAGEAAGMVVAFEDVTEIKRLQAALARQEHLASLGELSAGLAHELRNPLAALSGAVEMLSTDAVEGDDARLFELIRRESVHLGKLVSDFLAFARPPRPALREGDLGALLAQCCETFQPQAAARGCVLECGSVPAPARFDPDQMCQAVTNLLRNAVEASAEGGRIAASVRPAGDEWAIEVEDDGPGVAPEIAGRIFEPFFTTKQKGTGLGLALVARITEAHGGTVDVASREGGGARFVITLPRQAGASGATAAPRS